MHTSFWIYALGYYTHSRKARLANSEAHNFNVCFYLYGWNMPKDTEHYNSAK